MPTRTKRTRPQARGAVVDQTMNQVHLVGRLSQDPELRELPSGDPLWTFRVVVPRSGPPSASKATVDALDCSVWTARCRRSVSSWRAGDLVEVTGAMRRRFFRVGGSAASRVEVEVGAARLIRRRASA